MSRLFIAGDSFASFAKDQPIGNSWSEILASELNLELYNLARPGSSNFAIALQVEWISENVMDGDYVVVYLTDNHRKLLPDLDVTRDPDKHILDMQNLHRLQRSGNVLKYSDVPYLLNAGFFSEGKEKNYFRDWFDVELQTLEDKLLITGALAKLSTVTNNFIVCRGGFGTLDLPYYGKNKRYTRIMNIDHSMFCIKESQYVKYTSEYLVTLSGRTSYINHIDDLAHKKFSILLNKIIKERFEK